VTDLPATKIYASTLAGIPSTSRSEFFGEGGIEFGRKLLTELALLNQQPLSSPSKPVPRKEIELE
jgi:hypothetical protein